MRVRCIATSLNSQQKGALRITTATTADHQIIPGKIYLVLGITLALPVEPHGGGIQYQILNDFGSYSIIPAPLCEVVDGRCSRYWLARQKPNGSLLLWPQEFYGDFFHDDVSEGSAEAMNMFKQVILRLQSEFE
jgi:hypothetical protein